MLDRKKVATVSWGYGIVVYIANLCGLVIPTVLNTSSLRIESLGEWTTFLADYDSTLDLLLYLDFIVPTVICILYITLAKEKKESHFVNLPIAYSAIGISGWGVYLLQEVICLYIAKKLNYLFDPVKVFSFSLMYVFLEAMIAFTFSYFIIETIHRKYVLPKFFPHGQISKKKGIKTLSVKLLFSMNYISVTLFPSFFLLIMYLLVCEKYSFSLETSVYIVLGLIVVMGLIITILFETYFEKPLDKFKNTIQKINDNDYKTKVNIITNDSFGELADIFNDMIDSIQEKTTKLLDVQNDIITTMAIMIESRDNSTGGHIKRTSDCVRVFVAKLKTSKEYSFLKEEFFDSVIKAAPMHDLGKIAIDDAILRKPGKFTPQEYEAMKKHSEEGARIVGNVLANIENKYFKQIAINVAHYHHEKWNGEGYPQKLCKNDIPLEARIMALADSFDALVSKRCYKESYDYDKVYSIISESLGTHFDPSLGKVFLECIPELKVLYSTY